MQKRYWWCGKSGGDATRIRSNVQRGAKIQKAGLEFINMEIGRCKDKGETLGNVAGDLLSNLARCDRGARCVGGLGLTAFTTIKPAAGHGKRGENNSW